jgi:hypothetical protein
MSKSYRIRTNPGVDKSLNVQIEQDFEYLEILSLKLLQSEIYTRQCSDYGVVIGRVSVNNGFGIPNAKVSIFIPLESEDEENPIIGELYPYKTLNDVNEDGYRYNLLPYKNSYNGHRATGTFFDRHDVLVDPILIEVFDKYYKYTATTNDSGDFMLFGVPVGSHQIVMDVDLSDIGEFSLSPQDLVRMGVATEQEVAGTNFKVGENLRTLPQIVNIIKTIQVEPLWGQENLCEIGINRTDFDLSGESNIDIRPTSVFMGSIISSPDDSPVRRDCKPKGKLGYLCNLTTNSGEILAIRQTIFQDEDGRPILESVDLDQGGLVIDENGTWLLDVPMNLDYVTTNEFGEKVISNDPKIGIPTSGKYRFKVKWGQSPTLNDPVKRGYFLVPNVKEYGWGEGGGAVTNPIDKANSYAFSLDWSEYGDDSTSTGQSMIQEAIDCGDRFYPMVYNKVYTVSQFIDEQREGTALQRYVGIKNILDSECDSTNNKFPTNDGNLRFDMLYVIFSFISIILNPIFFSLIITMHLLYFLIWFARIIIVPYFIIKYIALFVSAVAGIVNAGFPSINIGMVLQAVIYLLAAIFFGVVLVLIWLLKLKPISVPLLTYPDCKMCDCKQGGPVDEDPGVDDITAGIVVEEEEDVLCSDIISDAIPINIGTIIPSISPVSSSGAWKYVTPPLDNTPNVVDPGPGTVIVELGLVAQMTGYVYNSQEGHGESAGTPKPKLFKYADEDDEVIGRWSYSLSLPIADRINLFNTKAKYFDSDVLYNPGGGVNRMTVKFNPGLEPGKFHYDNTVVLLCSPESLTSFNAGQMISFNNPSRSGDVNLTDAVQNIYGTNSIPGDTISNIVTNTLGYTIPSVEVNYSNPDGSGNESMTYYDVPQITGATDVVNFYKFPSDVEYFQVITGMTYSEFSGQCGTSDNSLNERFIDNDCRMGYNPDKWNGYQYKVQNDKSEWGGPINVPTIENIKDHENLCVVILNRGVDPHSLPTEIEYGLGIIFGFGIGNEDSKTVVGQYRLNIPINGGYKNVSHDNGDYLSNENISTDLYTGQDLYYDSFLFQPSVIQYTGFTSDLLSYYSKLDNRSLVYAPSCGEPSPPPVSFYTDSNTTYGIRIKTSNHYSNEFLDYEVNNAGRRTFGPGILLPITNPRGYYPNEIVEGSTAMGWNPANNLEDVRTFYYAPMYNTTGNTFNFDKGSSGRQIVMRGDRLPTSTVVENICCNGFPLQKNNLLKMYRIPNQGVLEFGEGVLDPSSAGNDSYGDFDEETTNIVAINSIINSFTCEGSAPLECYEAFDGNMTVKPFPNDCYKSGRNVIFQSGCFKFITRILVSLPIDLKNMAEWISRNMISLGACRNVFSHRFNNNWINGTLFAFPFSNDVFYTSPTSSNPNQPISNYCNKTIYLDDTFNFYYRSSPYFYDGIANKFVGDQKGIKYPTTMMDLGPINVFIQEIVLSDDYDGYVVNKINTTTYGEVDNILNLFIISRLINSGFLRNILGVFNILGYFSRFKLSFDGDYSQIISISSELGVAPFQSSNYPDNPPGYQNPIFFNNASSNKAVMGIFFSSNTQTRDYISPKRQILNPFTSAVDGCSFNDINIFSQVIPMYQWEIENNDDANGGIFGYQKNTWRKEQLGTSTHPGLFSHKYQDLDRLDVNSRYFRTLGGGNQTYFDKGYIYSVSGVTINIDIDESLANWDLNVAGTNAGTQWITVGGPFHFYFGLRQGGSAFDRFRQKWINTEIIIN